MALGALALLTIGARPAPDLERIVDAASGHIVTAIINGRPMKLRVELDANYWITLNAASAARAGLDGSWIKGTVPVSSVPVKFNSSATRLKIGAWNEKHRITWIDRTVIEGADGIIGPSLLPENRVTLTFHPPAPGERTIELAIDNSRYFGSRYKLRVGEETLWVNFTPHRPQSVATAAAGAHLAQMQDGHWSGEPRLVRIELGIDRPGRPMTLRKPFDIGGLMSSSFMVRTADYRGKFQLPPDKEPDPGEILVTGRTSKGRARFLLSLGRDALGGCSSITHDKKRETLTLHCL